MNRSSWKGCGDHCPPLSRNERRTKRRRAALAGVAVAGTVLAPLAMFGSSASATTAGVGIASGLTRPAGGVWLQPNTGAGHFYVADNVLGLCQVTTTGGTTGCQGNAKGGETAYDPATQKVYVADNSSKTNQVARYRYDPVGDKVTFEVMVQMAFPADTTVAASRAQGVALMTAPSGVQTLYAGFVRSGAILSVDNPATAGQTPTVKKIGATADARGGVAALAGFTYNDSAGVRHDNLYIGEAGGNGMTAITDIDGTGGRPACTSATPCTPAIVHNAAGAVVSFLAGGLVSNGKVLFIGDAPLSGAGKVLVFNPLTNLTDVLSTTVPAYTSTFDGQTRSSYFNIGGLALGANGDIFVGDDPSRPLATPVTAQGHLWKVPANAFTPVISSMAPASGSPVGGDTVVITGTNLSVAAGSSTVTFGSLPAAVTSCSADGTSCTVTSPKAPGAGPVDVRVTNGDGQTSAISAPADQFSYNTVTAPAGSPVVNGMTPTTGVSTGGTTVTMTGSGLTNADGTAPTVIFGTVAATSVTCVDATTCTAVSPPGSDGQTVNVQVTTNVGNTVAGAFTYRTPVAALFSSGITAPKGGDTWIPDATPAGGHYWVSDHSNGFCRIDPLPAGSIAPDAVNVSFCDPGFTIGSPGQAVYDPRPDAAGSTTHNVYVPDNAVKSPGVWKLTFDPATATVSNPVGLAPGSALANQKANGLALDPAKDALYVGDLVDGNIRRINGVNGDPRLQTVDTVGVTQNQRAVSTTLPRGINGTMSLLDGKLYLPENTAATYIDTTQPCAAVGTTTPCVSQPINLLSPLAAKVFVAGMGTDQVHHLVYVSASPGGANATIYRWDPATITAANPGGGQGIVYATGGKAPANLGAAPARIECTTSCTRPADSTWTPGGPTSFNFAQGLYVDPNNSSLNITEDATAGARAGRGNVWSVPFIP